MKELLKYVRVKKHSWAVSICQRLRLYNYVERQPRDILRHPHFTIFEGRELVGWVGCSKRYGSVYEVRHLTVLPQARGRGLGHAALDFILQKLRQNGATYCYAHIRRDNAVSQELFIQHGFVLMREGWLRKYTRSLTHGLQLYPHHISCLPFGKIERAGREMLGNETEGSIKKTNAKSS